MAAKKKKKAKRRTRKPEAVSALPVMAEPEIELKLSMGTEDIVAIGVAKYEDDLRTEINLVRGRLNVVKKDLEKARKTKEIEVNKQGEKAIAAKVSAYAAAAKPLGLKALEYDSTCLEETKTGALKIRVTLKRRRSDRDGYQSSSARPDPYTANALVKKAHKTVKDLEEQLSETQSELMELQGYLTDIPAYERKVRAHVAARALKSSKNGQEILKAIGGAPEQVKILPAGRA